MPRPGPPPTPGSSSDLRGKDGGNLSAPTFNLPPTAFNEHHPDRASASTTPPSANESDSSYRPVSPTSPADVSRKRPAQATIMKDDFALPPPPTRSRKIIQMQPKDAEENGSGSATASPNVTGKTPAAGTTGGRKKGNNANSTAAGRKIARKTAHSLIERRRRSKMNEEFGVLKEMIPACKGQEMHKLAILQASIDYLRYLEQCVSDLQTNGKSPAPQPPARRQEEDLEDDEDEEMEDDANNQPPSSVPTPTTSTLEQSQSRVSLPSLSTMTAPVTSPGVVGNNGRNYSISSASQPSYSPYFHSTQPSPAFGPPMTGAPVFSHTFGLGSPALKPNDSTNTLRQIAEGSIDRQLPPAATSQSAAAYKSAAGDKRRSEHELDQEATAALLMLNSDRRNWRASQSNGNGNGNSNSGGMSVRDLLSG